MFAKIRHLGLLVVPSGFGSRWRFQLVFPVGSIAQPKYRILANVETNVFFFCESNLIQMS
jgi:hypothetical protein